MKTTTFITMMAGIGLSLMTAFAAPYTLTFIPSPDDTNGNGGYIVSQLPISAITPAPGILGVPLVQVPAGSTTATFDSSRLSVPTFIYVTYYQTNADGSTNFSVPSLPLVYAPPSAPTPRPVTRIVNGR